VFQYLTNWERSYIGNRLRHGQFFNQSAINFSSMSPDGKIQERSGSNRLEPRLPQCNICAFIHIPAGFSCGVNVTSSLFVELSRIPVHFETKLFGLLR
jgi:hypothetical protein